MCIFLLSSFDFGWYFIHFDFVLSLRTRGRGGGGGGLLKEQNPLSVMKVILSTVPKLTMCVKTVTYIQENTSDG